MRRDDPSARMRRLLILTHRYLGIPLSALFVVWFVSGIVMMYTGGMPQLTPAVRIERLTPLDLDAVRLSAAQAATAAGVGLEPGEAKLLTVQGRPAYRFGAGPFAATVFADDGRSLTELEPPATRAIAAGFLGVPESAIEYRRTVQEPDQWTLLLAGELPLHTFDVADGRGTEIYVSPYTAEVVLSTTVASRALAWVGTIPHWFYFTPLRVNQPLWYWSVVWASVLGCAVAALGLVLGVVQLRKTRPFRMSAAIPYRGWMRWHYVSGAVFGMFALTWVFSGLLSMEPFGWTSARGLELPRDALAGGPLDLGAFPQPDAAQWRAALDGHAAKEIELLRIQDRPYYAVHYAAAVEAAAARKRERLHQPYAIAGRRAAGRLLIDADTLRVREEPFAVESLLARLAAAAPAAPLAEHALLPDYDSYYYSRGRQTPLPVLRVKFADPLETWVYVDPAMGRVLGTVHRLERLERWLFNGLHSLDFAFWYDKRPLWDVGMILLSIGALGTSVIGLCLGVKRLRRDAARFAVRRTAA